MTPREPRGVVVWYWPPEGAPGKVWPTQVIDRVVMAAAFKALEDLHIEAVWAQGAPTDVLSLPPCSCRPPVPRRANPDLTSTPRKSWLDWIGDALFALCVLGAVVVVVAYSVVAVGR